jgi:AraC-like DNA-binding protein
VHSIRADAGLWRDRTFAEGHWRDPELTLPELAKRTGSSAAHISKLVNRGLGQNFNEAINRMRIAGARRRLQDPSDTCEVLEIALDAGFSSKASFNRCFKAYTGTTQSAVRAGYQ